MDHSSQAVCPRACCSAAEKPTRSPCAAAEYPLLTAATRESLSTAVKTEQPRIRKGNSALRRLWTPTWWSLQSASRATRTLRPPRSTTSWQNSLRTARRDRVLKSSLRMLGLSGNTAEGGEGTRGEERRTSPGSEPALRVGIPNPAPPGQPGRSAWLGGCLPVGVEG